MGQQGSKESAEVQDKQQKPSPQATNEAVGKLFGQSHAKPSLEQLMPPLLAISRILSEEGSFEKRKEGFYANPTLLRCVRQPLFQAGLASLLNILRNQINDIARSNFMVMIPRQRFRKNLNLANFLIFFTDQNLAATLNRLSSRPDLHPQTELLLQQLPSNSLPDSIDAFLPEEEISSLRATLRVGLTTFLGLHSKVLSRSDFTLKIVDKLLQSLFILYAKCYFASAEVAGAEREAYLKELLQIGAYFLGMGVDTKTPSIYECAVLLLTDLVCAEQLPSDLKAPPSHLFKSLPLINHNQLLHWVKCVVLFSLKYVKEGQLSFCRLNVNRIPSLRLLVGLFEKVKATDKQLCFMLEELCLQTLPALIERVYVSRLAELSAAEASQIIKKYAHAREISYNVKGGEESLKLTAREVELQLERLKASPQQEITATAAKYVVQVIFQTSLLYEYGDRALWNLILAAHSPPQRPPSDLQAEIE